MNYKESLKHMFDVNQLNEKGLREYIKVLVNDNIELKLRILDLENEVSNRR